MTRRCRDGGDVPITPGEYLRAIRLELRQPAATSAPYELDEGGRLVSSDEPGYLLHPWRLNQWHSVLLDHPYQCLGGFPWSLSL